MVSILLTILKVLGMSLAVILGILIVLLLLVLFVPVRYRLSGSRKTEDEGPLSLHIKVTWLMHFLNAVFSYPGAPCLKVRIAFVTVFRSDKLMQKKDGAKEASGKKDKSKKRAKEQPASGPLGQPAGKDSPNLNPGQEEDKKEDKTGEKRRAARAGSPGTDTEGDKTKESDSRMQEEPAENQGGEEECGAKEGFFKKLIEFIRKLKDSLKKIRYTISQICDKIKHIVNNIQYYTEIIKSETFSRAWKVCSGQALSLLKHILPGKVEGSLHIGMGDPAGTGQILALYGMLYPFIGNHIDIQPDFEQKIIEGELFIKGRITVFKALKTAWIIYFNRDLRRLIKLFKREAA